MEFFVVFFFLLLFNYTKTPNVSRKINSFLNFMNSVTLQTLQNMHSCKIKSESLCGKFIFSLKTWKILHTLKTLTKENPLRNAE